MSTQPRISDDEMQYFQFKARQMFLLRKEDHEWNQFCKRNTCSCCLCQAQTGTKISKEVGIQASSANVPSRINRNINIRTGIQNKGLPQTLNEIKTKLDKIDLSLSQMYVSPQNEIVVNQQLPDKQAPTSSSASGRNTLNDKRMELIQNSLKGSLQRLQSAAGWKGKPISMNGQKKSSGFFLPRDLQEQRIIARRAYLASLAKLGNKNKTTEVLNSAPKARDINKRANQKQTEKSANFSQTKVIHKKKPNVQSKKEESNESDITTAVQSSVIMDENIENAVDAIVDDLMGETVLAINKIRHVKSKKTIEHVGEVKNIQQSKPCETSRVAEGLADEDGSHNQHESHWEKIRRNLFKLKTAMGTENNTATSPNNTIQNRGERLNLQRTVLSQNTIPKSVGKDLLQTSELERRTELFIDSKTAKETSKQSKEFWKYLKRISRTKKGNFDPWTLSNMIAESLLDDCLLDVCQELHDVPTSLITELYDREFLQSL